MYVVGKYRCLKIAIIEAMENAEAACNKDYLFQISEKCIF